MRLEIWGDGAGGCFYVTFFSSLLWLWTRTFFFFLSLVRACAFSHDSLHFLWEVELSGCLFGLVRQVDYMEHICFFLYLVHISGFPRYSSFGISWEDFWVEILGVTYGGFENRGIEGQTV